MDMADMAMARGLLMPRLTMVAMDTADSDTAMAKGLLTPRLTMEAMDTADTDMARGQLMPTMVAMDMADMAMASNSALKPLILKPPKISIVDLNLFSKISNCY